MTRDQFLSLIRTHQPDDLVARYLGAREVSAFATAAEYDGFKQRVVDAIGQDAEVCLVGSGNWGYSLNPEKGFKPFDMASDVDVAIVSADLFVQTWDQIRDYHRKSWYAIDYEQRQRLRRNGENIYSGFVSPAWIPERTSPTRFSFLRLLNRLSDESVAFRKVTALYFRNTTEVADYYRRGFILARQKAPP
ncbi:hypothetical protein [Methylibium rhizosphaerae]|uniref:hypothetical protein n=1 Tax=Methylibium rhizosphaerae TaxID=2570323 RepID=UPI00112BEA16|nr:hypothetical protein [Methylibium rhizosphaerae]